MKLYLITNTDISMFLQEQLNYCYTTTSGGSVQSCAAILHMKEKYEELGVKMKDKNREEGENVGKNEAQLMTGHSHHRLNENRKHVMPGITCLFMESDSGGFRKF